MFATSNVSTKHPFDIIFKFAKKQKHNQLTEFLKQGDYSVDVVKNGYSPVMMLAKMGEEEAVWFLINHFKASKNAAALGAAEGGNMKLSRALQEKSAAMSYIARGAGRRGDRHLIHELSRRMPQRKDFVLGAAFAGHRDLVFECIEHNWVEEDCWFLCDITVEAAAGGHADLALELVEYAKRKGNIVNADDVLKGVGKGCSEESINNFISQWPDRIAFVLRGIAERGDEALLDKLAKQYSVDVTDALVFAAAKGGYIGLSKKLKSKHTIQPFFDSGLCTTIQGAIAGGHREVLEKLLKLLENTDNRQRYRHILDIKGNIHFAAKSGERDMLDYLIQFGADYELAFKAACEEMQIEAMNQLCPQVHNKKYLANLLHDIRNNIDFKSESTLLKLFSLIDNPHLRETLYGQAKYRNKKLDGRLLTKANRINYLIHENAIYFTQAYAWTLPQLLILTVLLRPTFNTIASQVIPDEIFLKIFSYVTELADKEAIELLEKYQTREPYHIYEGLEKFASQRFFKNIPNTVEEKIASVQERQVKLQQATNIFEKMVTAFSPQQEDDEQKMRIDSWPTLP